MPPCALWNWACWSGPPPAITASFRPDVSGSQAVMARRHWLDPLARRLLIASGQIKPPAAGVGGEGAGRGGAGGSGAEALHNDIVERDLLALRLAQNPALALRTATEAGGGYQAAAASRWTC
ncbi:MAG: hypothetical protein NTW51_01690 [Cyanobacteria bacterium]|nr:hypothetical protein [Cyanobacteriota bacterium]